MDFIDKITDQIKAAMKAKDKVRLEALRGVKKELLEAKAAKGVDAVVSEEEAVKIIQKLVKQRKDTAQVYIEQNRPELAEKEIEEADCLAVFLPKQLTEQEIEVKVQEIITKVGASSMKEMGKVMGVASNELAGSADGKVISAIVKKLLS